ncbi:hypothetical protein ARMGADRAFT_518700 [Armillaria gallica]|uniref:Uncharacterized protein n=1 Tax=Armillaria gallica TaxID=47427 RepID=A0A2H3E0Z2_ARMGA|nr:hypothetical protein ARMGADRAFT_518700 [Armillaria gallica]
MDNVCRRTLVLSNGRRLQWIASAVGPGPNIALMSFFVGSVVLSSVRDERSSHWHRLLQVTKLCFDIHNILLHLEHVPSSARLARHAGKSQLGQCAF